MTPLRVKQTADGELIEIRTYFPFRPKGKAYGPNVLEQLRAAKTPADVHRIMGDHLADLASRRTRRRWHAAAEAQLAKIRRDSLVGAS